MTEPGRGDRPSVAETTLRLARAARVLVDALAPGQQILGAVIRSNLFDLDLAVSDFEGTRTSDPAGEGGRGTDAP